MTKNKGWAIHCHHDTLMEWCYDYGERVDAIRKKPRHEVATRMRLFKLLPDAAMQDLPVALVSAGEAYNQAREAYKQAREAWEQAWESYKQVMETWDQAEESYKQAREAWEQAWESYKQVMETYKQVMETWDQAGQTRWHDKWCGCRDWDGREIRFRNERDIINETVQTNR